MRTKTPLTTIVACLVTTLFVAPGASAGHCTGTVTQVEAGTETVYVIHAVDTAAPYLTLYVYLESNGEPGLQQGGQSQIPDNPYFVSEGCGHSPNPDRLLL